MASRTLKYGLPTAAALGVGGAIAVAGGGIPGANGTINGCYSTNTDTTGFSGRLRVIGEGASCPQGEVAISWNQQGPPGPPGPQGAGLARVPGLGVPQGPTQAFSGGTIKDNASVDIFAKVTGVEGGSKDAKHKGWSDLQGFSWGVTLPQAGAGGGGGAGAGKATFSSFDILKRIDSASPKFLQIAAQGTHIKTVDVEVLKAGAKAQKVLAYKLSDVLISSFSSGVGVLSERTSLNYAKIEISYYQQKADGTVGAPIKSGWDVKANKKI